MRKTGLRRRALILIEAGVETADDLAERLETSRACMSVTLQQMCDAGTIKRGPREDRGTVGRPFVRWRAVVVPMEAI